VEIERIIAKGQPRQKLMNPFYLNQQAGHEVNTCNSSYLGAIHRKITIQGCPDKNVRLYLKNKKP
jgi:hypothetical protein